MTDTSSEIIEEAYRHPRHRGSLPEATHSFQDENPLCGDVVCVELLVERGRVTAARFDGRGCAISQASAELMMERIEGAPIDEIETLGRDDVLKELELAEIAPARLRCALLPLEVLKRAVRGAG